ncbi:MAG: hypothetical protein RSB32_05930 [Mucinivorans sp.]
MIELSNNVVYSPEMRAVVEFGSSSEQFAAPDAPLIIGGNKITPWGANNDLPQQVLAKIGTNDVTGSNINFNVTAAYGQGIVPMMSRGGELSACDNDEVNMFFEDNDINGYFLEQINDLITFNNVFPEIIVSRDGRKIVRLSHKEAAFSRWGVMGLRDSHIQKHYYHYGWADGIRDPKEIDITSVLSPTFTFADLEARIARRERRFVMRVTLPTPGRTYYARPSWWSIFESGTYDLSSMIPKTKIALLKNSLSIRNVIYISDKYWSDFLESKGIASGDKEKIQEAKVNECKRLSDFVSNTDSKGGTLIATKESLPGSVGKAVEDRHIIIEPIKLGGDGELVKDSEEASNIICYAMSVHPSLIGATPGKNGGSLGGSDKRELFMMKQALLRPYRDRLLMPLNLIKRYNKWPKELVFALPEYQLPTLDQDKGGKQTTIQSPE